MALRGIDASRHQGEPDWSEVADDPGDYTFAFLKATDGVSYRYVDWFHRNRLRAWQAGFIVGAYHFLLDHHSGAAQARYYVSEVSRSGGFHGVVPIVDIEREADGTTPRESHLRAFVAEFRRLVPNRTLLIYTGRWYWVGVLGNPYGADLGDLWHSEYDGISPIDFDVANGPELERYGGWDNCLVWQHTSSGRVRGIAGNVDLNLFYSSQARLNELAGLTTTVEPLPPERNQRMDMAIRPDGTIDIVAVGSEDQRIRHWWVTNHDQIADAQPEFLDPGRGVAVTCGWSEEFFIVTVIGVDGNLWTNRWGPFFGQAPQWTGWGQGPAGHVGV